MKSKILLSLLAISLLTFLVTSVSASHNYPNTEYTLDFRNGDYYARNYRYADFYGYPAYKVYDRPYRYGNHNDNSWGSDDFTRREKRQAVRFLERSFNERYDVTAGKTSGEAFCNGCQVADKDYSASNWGNKPAFDLVATGNNQKNYYYKVNYDPASEKFNWRF